MKVEAPTKTVTLRLPQDIYLQTSELARRRNLSLNALALESIRRVLQEDSDRALSDAFDLLSEHPEACDVEYAMAAQAEVARSNEP